MEERFCPRTWIDIDLDALIANYQTAKGMTQALVTCVVKSNAYGHGAGARGAGAAGGGLRELCRELCPGGHRTAPGRHPGEILVMGLTEQVMLPACIQAELTLTLGTLQASGRRRPPLPRPGRRLGDSWPWTPASIAWALT